MAEVLAILAFMKTGSDVLYLLFRIVDNFRNMPIQIIDVQTQVWEVEALLKDWREEYGVAHKQRGRHFKDLWGGRYRGADER